MTIEFRCPNGHRLSCPDERAGMSGKCPKCKALFRVPAPGEVETPTSDSGVSEAEPAEPPSDHDIDADVAAEPHESDPQAEWQNHAPEAHGEVQSEPAAAERQTGTDEERIVFLCPNGHKLNCPASMQGRPGKCPHCGATFLVPEFESEDLSEQSESNSEREASAELVAGDESVAAISEFDGDVYVPGSFPFDFSNLTNDVVPGHPMAGLMQRLWPLKQTGSVVELYLKGGEVIAPEWFSPRYSQETYGMFAFPENDGSYTMTAVHWDAIERIAVRGVSALPQGMFDDGA